VVGGHNDEGIVRDRIQQPLETTIYLKNFTTVRIPAPVGGRFVRGVHIKQVHPQKTWLSLLLGRFPPREGLAHHLPPGALDAPEPSSAGHILRVKLVMVPLEPAIKSPSTVQHIGPDKRTGTVPVGQQLLGQEGNRWPNPKAPVVADAVPIRVPTRKKRRVRRQRKGNRGPSIPEEDGLGSEPVDIGRSRQWIPVGSQTVRAGRVERDHDHVGSMNCGRRLV
jgi:hypothetical protein